jgi:hypothetical protein
MLNDCYNFVFKFCTFVQKSQLLTTLFKITITNENSEAIAQLYILPVEQNKNKKILTLLIK